MSEKTIAVFKYGKDKYNLLEITIPSGGYDKEAQTCYDTYEYMIVKNRRRKFSTKWESQARAKFSQYIVGELMQQKITF